MNEKEEQLSHIKKIGEVERISKEEFEFRIQEIAACKRDICYFAEKYFRIISLDKGLHVIKLYQKQKELLRFFTEENRCLTLASRQTGKCVCKNTKITVKNKKTDEIQTIPIEKFYELCKNKVNNCKALNWKESL